MPKKLPKTEAERIAKEYGADVPTDLTIEKLPAQKMTQWETITRREAIARSRRIFMHNLKFRNAAKKREAAARRALDNPGDIADT